MRARMKPRRPASSIGGSAGRARSPPRPSRFRRTPQPNRRSGMRRALLIVAVAAITGNARADDAPILPTVEVAPGIFVHEGVQQNASPENGDEIANVGFIVGDDAVMVVDPGGSEAEGRRLRAAVRARTALPIRFLVL